jgi:hypothetical protein
MTNQEMRDNLKVDLGITVTNYDSRLDDYIMSAQAEIAKEGATLDLDQIDHCQLVIMYAGWQWRKRETGEPMPRMVRYQLNNLVFEQKMSGGGQDD